MRRGERVLRIFPNDASALRLIGSLLAEHHNAWQKRKFLDLGAYSEWKAAGSEHAAVRVITLAGQQRNKHLARLFHGVRDSGKRAET